MSQFAQANILHIWRRHSSLPEFNRDLHETTRPFATFNGAPRLVFENGGFRLPQAGDPNKFIRGEDLVALGAASNFYLTLTTAGNRARDQSRYYHCEIFLARMSGELISICHSPLACVMSLTRGPGTE